MQQILTGVAAKQTIIVFAVKHNCKHQKRIAMKQRYTRDDGQGLVEYALILVLVAVVVIAILTILGPQVGNVFSRVVDGLGVASNGGGGGSSSSATVTSIDALRGGADVGVNVTVSANTNVTVTDSQSGQSVSVGCNSACSVTLTAVGPNAGTVTATADGGSSQSANYPSE